MLKLHFFGLIGRFLESPNFFYHDAFMPHALHVLDAPDLQLHYSLAVDPVYLYWASITVALWDVPFSL